MPTTPRKVPARAFHFSAHDVKFGELAASDAAAAKGAPVHIVLRTGDAINHPYWGKVVHDMGGMQAHKDTFPLDYCHDPKEVIGHFCNLDTSKGQLDCDGMVMPCAANDRASEILSRQAAGTPYEASVKFDPNTALVEELYDGQMSMVNGKQVTGPATIFRQWELRGGALCPQGADKNAHAEFTSAGDGEFIINIHSPEPAMATAPAPEKIPETVPAAPAAASELAAKPAEVAAPAYDRKAEGAKFTAAFGDLGAKYFADGLSYEEASAQFTASIRKENEELKKCLAGANLAGAITPGAALSFGESTPLSSNEPETDAGQLTPAQMRYGKSMGAFVAGIELPGSKK